MYEYRNGLIIGLLVMMNVEACAGDLESGHKNYGSVSTQKEPKPPYLVPLQRKEPSKKKEPLVLEAEPETASYGLEYNLVSNSRVRSNSDSSCLVSQSLKSAEMLNEHNEARARLENARTSLAVFSPLEDQLKACVEEHNSSTVCHGCIVEDVQKVMAGAFAVSLVWAASILATESSDDVWVPCTLAGTLGSGAIVGLKGAVQYAWHNYKGAQLVGGLGTATVEVRNSLREIWKSAAELFELRAKH